MRSPTISVLSLAVASSSWLVLANPQVNLGYATYEGATLGNGVNQFLGMRYAAPPLGQNRFKRAVDPLSEEGIVLAKEVRRKPRTQSV
jgi:carboxylesterase type B